MTNIILTVLAVFAIFSVGFMIMYEMGKVSDESCDKFMKLFWTVAILLITVTAVAAFLKVV